MCVCVCVTGARVLSVLQRFMSDLCSVTSSGRCGWDPVIFLGEIFVSPCLPFLCSSWNEEEKGKLPDLVEIATYVTKFALSTVVLVVGPGQCGPKGNPQFADKESARMIPICD